MANKDANYEKLLDDQLADFVDNILNDKEGTTMNEEIQDLGKTLSLLKSSLDADIMDAQTKASLKRKVKNAYGSKPSGNIFSDLFDSLVTNKRQFVTVGLSLAAVIAVAVLIPGGISEGGLSATASQLSGYFPILILVFISIIAYFWKMKK